MRLFLMRLFFLLLLVGTAYTNLSSKAVAASLIADLSEYQIRIETDFTGARIYMFGVIDHQDSDARIAKDGSIDRSSTASAENADAVLDVIIIVRGPPTAITVREKQRSFGIWINRQEAHYSNVPSFYTIATTRPFDDIASPETFHQIGLRIENLSFAQSNEPSSEPPFPEALIRLMTAQGLYQELPQTITVQDGKLFRTVLDVGTNVPTGRYEASFYLFRDGEAIVATTLPISIEKRGMNWQIYNSAHQSPYLFGLFAVIMALSIGWLATFIARRL